VFMYCIRSLSIPRNPRQNLHEFWHQGDLNNNNNNNNKNKNKQ
jgi:hypothetical protein